MVASVQVDRLAHLDRQRDWPELSPGEGASPRRSRASRNSIHTCCSLYPHVTLRERGNSTTQSVQVEEAVEFTSHLEPDNREAYQTDACDSQPFSAIAWVGNFAGSFWKSLTGAAQGRPVFVLQAPKYVQPHDGLRMSSCDLSASAASSNCCSRCAAAKLGGSGTILLWCKRSSIFTMLMWFSSVGCGFSSVGFSFHCQRKPTRECVPSGSS